MLKEQSVLYNTVSGSLEAIPVAKVWFASNISPCDIQES